MQQLAARSRFQELCFCFVAATALSALVGCDKAEPASPAPVAPPVGNLELPISAWNTGSASGMEIVITPTEMYAGGTKVLDLDRGQVPTNLRRSRALPTLATALQAATKPDLTIVAHGASCFGTLARTIETAKANGFSNFHIAVRSGSAPTAARGYLTLQNPDILVGAAEPTFAEPRRSFREVNDAWAGMYDACRSARYIDCDVVPAERAKDDGAFYLGLFSRGQAMQMHFRRFGVPEVDPNTPTPPPAAAAPTAAQVRQGQERLPGQTADQTHPLDMLFLNVDHATFSFRFEVATQEDSAVTRTARILCGAARCDVVIESDEETPLMRIVTLVGSAFPNGAQMPRLALRVPG